MGTVLKLANTIPVVFAVFASLSTASAQHTLPAQLPKPPQLKLEIIPLKKIYKVGEAAVVKYRLTSLADGTVCFPTPAIEVSGSVAGYVSLDAQPPNSRDERDFFIEDVWPRHPTEEELRDSVRDRWIRLGMSEPFDLKKKSDRIVSLGCTPPTTTIVSAPVTITAVDASNH